MGHQALHHQLVQGVQQGSSIVIGALIVLLQEADGPVLLLIASLVSCPGGGANTMLQHVWRSPVPVK